MLLSFSANTLDQATLEKTLVGRKEVVDRVEQELLEKILIGQTYQSLLIAPRGSGKTHITKLLHYRIKNNQDLDDKILVAYMNEDERGIANYSDFIRHILQSFVKHQEGQYDILMDLIYEVSGLPISKQEKAFENILLEFIGEKGLVILVENLNILFDKKTGMGLNGQNKLRSLMHEHNQFSILATSQNLFYQIQDANAPFYNFFNIDHLEKLSFQQAFELVEIQASLENNDALTKELSKRIFKGKVRAIYALTGGNHRLLVIFFNFLKVDFKSNLSEVFVKTMNDLKPYYEQFINALSPQQQKIIQYLSSNHTPKMGKEISRFCFIAPNTLSKQTAELVEKGLLGKNKKGKDIYYELREPLMRICFEINETTGGIAKLFIDFLTVLYSQEDLQKRYLKYKFGALLQEDNSKIIYEKEARFYKKSLSLKTQKILDNLTIPQFQNENELNQTIEMILCDLKINKEHLDNEQKATLDKMEKQFGKKLLKRIFIERTKGNQKAITDFNFFKKLATDEDFKKNAYLFSHLALLSHGNKDFSKAIKYLKKAIKFAPKNIKNYVYAGEIYLHIKKDYQNSIKYFDKALEINQELDTLFLLKGKAHLAKNEYDKATNALDNAIRLNPSIVEAYYRKGTVFEEQAKFKDAIKYYSLAVSKDSRNDWYHFNLGFLYFKINDYLAAINSLETAIEINAKTPIYHSLLGFSFYILKEYKKAINSYNKAIKLNPENSDHYSDLADTYTALDRYEDAIVSYYKAIELDPENSDYHSGLADTYSDFGKYEDAIAYYNKAIELNPKDSDHYSNLADTYTVLGRYKDAIAYYNKAIELNPENAYNYLRISNIYINLKNYELAIFNCSKAIEKSPKDQDYYLALGMIYLEINNISDAYNVLKKGLEIDDNHWLLNLGLLSYYLNINDLEKSKIQFEKSLQLSQMDNLSVLFHSGNLLPLFKYVPFENIKIYLHFLMEILKEKELLPEFWNAFTPAFFNVLINIEDYSENRLDQLNTYLQETFKPYKEMVIPLLYLDIGIRYLKKGEERAIYDFSKEERQVFQEYVLDKKPPTIEQ